MALVAFSLLQALPEPSLYPLTVSGLCGRFDPETRGTRAEFIPRHTGSFTCFGGATTRWLSTHHQEEPEPVFLSRWCSRQWTETEAMCDVIEASEDGGFDIPATPVDPPPSRPTNLPSREHPVPVQPKPRRIRIQLEDDDDDDDGDDDSEGKNDCERNPGASTGTNLTDAGQSEKGVGSPAVERPQYRIYKVEIPDDDPMLEIVVSLSTERAAAPISTAATAGTAKHLGATGSPQAPPCPLVNISSDGKSVVVEHDPGAQEGHGGGKDGVSCARGRFTLNLPQKVVPRTALSYFWDGDLTIRAPLAGIE